MKYRLFFFAVGNSKRERFTTTWYSMIQCEIKMFIVVNDIEVSRERLFDLHAPIIRVFWTSGEWKVERRVYNTQYLLLIFGHRAIKKIIRSWIYFLQRSHRINYFEHQNDQVYQSWWISDSSLQFCSKNIVKINIDFCLNRNTIV